MTDKTGNGANGAGTERLGSSGVGRRRFLAAAGAGVAGVSMAGCLGNLTGGGDPIRIGGVYLLSGIAQDLGTASASAAEVAVDALNQNDGINGRDVEIEVRDHGENPQQQIRSLVQEFGADVMIGLTSSGVTLNSAPTIESLGVPFTLTDIGTPFITEWDTDTYGNYYESEEGKAAAKPNIFRTNANTSINTYAMAKFAQDELDGITRVANIGPDYAYGHQCWDYFQAYAEGLGSDYEFVASEFPSLGASDMTPQINNILSADPDLVFTSFWAGDAVTFVRQAASQGLFEQVEDVFDTLGADPTVFQALGDNMPEGVHYSGWYWHSAFDNEYNTSFLEAWTEKYEGDDNVVNIPSFTGGSTWAAIHLYKAAIEAAGGTEPDGIISELEGASFEQDPRGPITIDEDSHQANAPTMIGETSRDDDVPYDGVGLSPTQTYTLDRSTATDLLQGTDLGPGV